MEYGQISIASSAAPSAAIPYFFANIRLTCVDGLKYGTAFNSDVIYVNRCNGKYLTLFDGSVWQVKTVPASQAVSIAALGLNQNYDMFAYIDNDGNVAYETVAWDHTTARVTNIVYQDGVLVKSGSPTRLYVGSFRTSGSFGRINFSLGSYQDGGGEAKLHLYNHYNKVLIKALVRDSTDSWAYSGSYRNANNSAGNRVSYIVGDDSAPYVTARYRVSVFAPGSIRIGIGVNSSTIFSEGANAIVFGNYQNLNAEARNPVNIGYHYFQAIEWSDSGSNTFYGDSGSNLDQSGLFADFFG